METCQWEIGTVWTGPKKCGKPAKSTVAEARPYWMKDVNYVCGIHRRKAERVGVSVTTP